MRKNLRYRILACIPFVLAFVYGQAQTPFAYKTPVAPVTETKFYTIPLSPRLLASCKKQDLSDIRIFDSAGATIPYILQSDLPVLTSNSYTPYAIISNTRRDSSTEVVIRNESAGSVSSIFLIIKNASAYRSAVLSGSDNRSSWFVIDENVQLEQTGNSSGDRYVQPISFPLSNYRYFKVIIHDKGLLPLNILQAGVYKDSSSFGKYLVLPLRDFKQKDSADRNSYLTVRFSDPYKIDKIKIRVGKPALYKRSYDVYLDKPAEYVAVEQGELRPDNNTVLLSAKTNELLIKIFNGDNPPLVIDSVIAYQVNQKLVTQLEKGKKYFIFTGNNSIEKPVYDLQYFRDSIPSALSEISAGNIEKITSPAGNTRLTSSHSKLILWTVIGLVLILLLFLTFNMSKEINKKKQQE